MTDNEIIPIGNAPTQFSKKPEPLHITAALRRYGKELTATGKTRNELLAKKAWDVALSDETPSREALEWIKFITEKQERDSLINAVNPLGEVNTQILMEVRTRILALSSKPTQEPLEKAEIVDIPPDSEIKDNDTGTGTTDN